MSKVKITEEMVNSLNKVMSDKGYNATFVFVEDELSSDSTSMKLLLTDDKSLEKYMVNIEDEFIWRLACWFLIHYSIKISYNSDRNLFWALKRA